MKKSFFLLCSLLLLGACRSEMPTVPIAVEPINTPGALDAAYPGAQTTAPVNPPSGYPGAVILSEATPAPLGPYLMPQVEVMGSDSGTLVGRLIDSNKGSAAAGLRLIVGTQEPLSGGGFVITMQENSSPQAITNEQGYFVIHDIEPGDYGLILWTPLGTKLLDEKDSNVELYYTITAGELNSIGDVHFTIP